MAHSNLTKNSHCSYCGFRFAESTWPRTCERCRSVSFVNPLPVAALIVPSMKTPGCVLAVRRANAPNIGGLCLPGGYIVVGESWQAAAARELFEETGGVVPQATIDHVTTTTTPGGHLIVFGRMAATAESILTIPWEPNEECSERVIVPFGELCFPTHVDACRIAHEALSWQTSVR